MDSQQDSPGARTAANLQTRFVVWAPTARTVAIDIVARNRDAESTIQRHLLNRSDHALFAGTISGCPAGTLYRIRKDNGEGRPDPRSQYQPFGVHGPSEVIDHGSFQWTDHDWRGIAKQDLVIYELHVGTFTEEGTFTSVITRLPELLDLGVTAIELMPIAQCPGRWNWGYDGVNLFAPRNSYGRPNDLKQLVDACHQSGLAVILDVVYNHIGPEGNYLNDLGPYTSGKFRTPWGDALDFDRRPVRDLVIDNVLHWLRDYHLDGLRLDAVHYFFDDGDPHILAEILDSFRQFERNAGRQFNAGRQLHLIAESNIFDSRFVGQTDRPISNYDAIWADCLMHSIYRIGVPNLQLTNRRYRDTDLDLALANGYVFQAPGAQHLADLPKAIGRAVVDRDVLHSLVIGLQTHDSVGNHPEGARLHQLTSEHFQKAAAVLVLLYPAIPLLFMGEEIAAPSTFPFFADFGNPQIRAAVDRGRHAEFPDHDWSSSLLPSDPNAFFNARLDRERGNSKMRSWYSQLLQLRRQGIRTGWLSATNFSTRCDPGAGTHQFSYSRASGEIHVCCCLAKSGCDPIAFDQLGIVQVMLNSRPGTTSLQGEHAVVWTVDGDSKRTSARHV